MAKTRGRGALAVAGIAIGVALGTAFGTYILAPNLPENSDPNAPGSADFAAAEQRADVNEVQAAQADSVIGHIVEDLVAGQLQDRPVLLMHTTDAEQSDIDDVAWLLQRAGALNAGRIQLEEQFFSQDSADQLKSIVANTLPAGAQLSETQLDPGTHAGEALGSGLLLNPESGEPQASTAERALLLNALRDTGFITYEDGTILPGQVVVLITGDSEGSGDESFAAETQALFARALDSRGTGMVVAGRIHTATDTGVIGRLRANPDAVENVSTVDSVDRTWGKMATVLSARDELADRSGAYGSAASAEAASPKLDGVTPPREAEVPVE
ncbi:Copper transporter MctB precursor [Corynebacterium faecale]|uniref:copper transporter n=1 Tax=Corynebacterium faecale TaxID=1758466 RepID=UPI0025B2C9B2|nr:copper transporter [Corynebacterium faecale]WJY92187.1 Copper transporter MctB precursor [Corynebacterium faecale]